MKQLTFGVAKDIITPAIPATMIGFGSVFGNTFTDIHDDLYVRTLLLQDGESSILLLSFDLLFHDDSLPESLRDYAGERYGIPRDHLLVTYTHTHFGPAVKGYDITFHTPEYERFLFDRAVSSIDRAFFNRRSGSMAYTRVEGDWNISRRLVVEGDTLFMPNPDGGKDKYLYLLKLCDEQGQLRALLTNFACHPSNWNSYRTLSAEYPGRLCQLLEAQHFGCTALFFQGCGADAKLKIGAKTSRFHPITNKDVNEAAAGMAERVRQALQEQVWRTLTPDFAARMFQIPAPLDVLPREYFERELETYRTAVGRPFDKSLVKPGPINANLFCLANAEYLTENYDTLPDYVNLNCGVIRLAEDMYIFTMAGEPSWDVKCVLSRLLPEEHMLFFGYNDAIAYVPTDKLLDEGGYEAGGRAVPEYRLKGPFSKGIDQLFVEYFSATLEKF